MGDMKRLAEGDATMSQRHRVECPVWHRPLYEFVPDGIVCKCRSCSGGTTHLTSWAEVDQYRASLVEVSVKGTEDG
jgi:hypothetical protein